MKTSGAGLKEIIERLMRSCQIGVGNSKESAAAPTGAPQVLFPNAGPSRRLIIIACLAAVYFVAAKLGLQLAYIHPSASSVWPGTAIALAAMLLLGYRVWPGIFFGALVANWTTAGSIATSLGIALGNTLEGLVGAYFLHRFANGRNVFDRAQDILKFVFLATPVSAVVSATIGVTSLFLGDFIPARAFASTWFTWWLGDTIGSVLLTPVLVLWSIHPCVRWNLSQILERILFLISFVFINLAVFGGLTPLSNENYPLEFLCVPFFIWAAFRLGQRETAAAVVVLAGIAIWGTLHGHGPYATRSYGESLLLLQSFIGVKAAMSLVLATLVADYRRVETELMYLAVTDPLTGLSNYRKFIDTLDIEIKRASRTERSFAILFLDVDNLKVINDQLGHVAGNQALCRVAEALRGSCRSIDTIARFGGDEFAVILPEADAEAAHQVAERIDSRLAQDHDGPPISVSSGIAVYPVDGERKETLVSAADHVLYQAKGRSRTNRQVAL